MTVAELRATFEISNSDPRRFADQMADGVRRAIVSGMMRPGEMLPGLVEIAEAFGVSMKISRQAYEQLSSEGYIVTRAGFGTVVLGRHERSWNGNVLFVLPDVPGAYYPNVFANELQNRMLEAGWLFTRTCVGKTSSRDDSLPALEVQLTQTFDMAIVLNGNARIEKALARKKLRTMVIRCKREAVLDEFVEHCRQAGVKKVIQVGMKDEGDLDAVPRLQAAGILAEREQILFKDGPGRLERIKQAAFDRVYAGLAEQARDERSLILFTDDFLAFGGIAALLARGVDVPGKVKLVTWSNRGFAPIGPWSITRIEQDPFKDAEFAAGQILKYLDGEEVPLLTELVPSYRKGQTFV